MDTINILKNLNSSQKQSLFFAQFSGKYFIFDAVYSDETAQFVSNPEPCLNEQVNVYIRLARNNSDAIFVLVDGGKIQMSLYKSEGLFDFYSAPLTICKTIKYSFLIIHEGNNFYYNKRGVFTDNDPNYNFTIIPGFKIPDWAKGAVMYQIFVDRFYNGDTTNDVVNNEYAYLHNAAKKIENWDDKVAPVDIANFYGGDLQGIIEKMAYLKDLGIGVIYLNPIFVSPSSHKYDIQDYDYVDPHFGVIIEDGGEPLYFEKFLNRYATMYMQRTTGKVNLEAGNKLFIKLVELAHENGMRVILDGVFNHCGAFNKWIDRENFYASNGYPAGAYRDKNSPYHNYFKWYDDAWPNNECYDSWWNHENHPKLFFEGSTELYNYILEVAKKWVSPPFNADGWRLDVAADLGYSKEFNHKFWRDFRNAVKSANPDALILAEHYGDPSEWLDGTQWDSIMNYDAFMEPITWFLTGMEKHSEAFREDMFCNAMAFENAMRYHMSRMPYQSIQAAMNELSNHDHSRFLTRTNMTVGRLHTQGHERANMGLNINIMMEAVIFQFVWLGAPTVYYGDEAGLCGWTDPDNRRTYPWGKENSLLIDLHKEMIKIHKDNTAIKSGSLEYLYMNYGIISFGRWDKENKIVCALNNNSMPKEFFIPVWKINITDKMSLKTLIMSAMDTFTTEKTIYTVSGGNIFLKMPPYSAIILKSY